MHNLATIWQIWADQGLLKAAKGDQKSLLQKCSILKSFWPQFDTFEQITQLHFLFDRRCKVETRVRIERVRSTAAPQPETWWAPWQAPPAGTPAWAQKTPGTQKLAQKTHGTQKLAQKTRGTRRLAQGTHGSTAKAPGTAGSLALGVPGTVSNQGPVFIGIHCRFL